MARKRLNVFNLAFLDVMSCGLGAVVLFFMVINAQVTVRSERANADLEGETTRMEDEVLDGRKNLVRLRTSLEEEKERRIATDAEAARLAEAIQLLKEQLAEAENRSLANVESKEDLMADIERLEAAKQRLAARSADTTKESGQRIRSFVGDGNRQYLTGMRMGGRRVLILVDSSASMLGRTLINVLRFRNTPDDNKRRAPKWRQTVNVVDWITTQIVPGTRFQIYAFNEQSGSVLPETTGQWLEVTDGAELTEAVDALRKLVPGKGTSLYKAFESASQLNPPPDNIYLLTDGLPTQSRVPPPQARRISVRDREKFFEAAIRQLPSRAPVNVMLFPMDGDPSAAGLFWGLALKTKGSMLTPARDWP
jgi:hypothetical protein